MTTYTSADVGVFLAGGYDILGTRTKLEIDTSTKLENTTVLGVSYETFKDTNLRTGKIIHDGFYDDAANSSNVALVGLAGSSQVCVIGIEGNTFAKRFIGFSGEIQPDYKRVLTVGALHKASANLQATGTFDDGPTNRILFPEGAAASATANGTDQDNGAGTVLGGAGYLEVVSLTLGGYTSLTVKIQHSTDGSTWADLVTFTNVTTAPGAQRIALAGNATVNRHVRSQYTYNGSGSSQTATIFVGFARN